MKLKYIKTFFAISNVSAEVSTSALILPFLNYRIKVSRALLRNIELTLNHTIKHSNS